MTEDHPSLGLDETVHQRVRLGILAMLCEAVDELLDADNLQGTHVAVVEFVNMMAAVGRHQDIAQELGIPRCDGLLDSTAWTTLIADTRDSLAAAGEPTSDGTRIGDHREALAHMRRTLGQFQDSGGAGQSPDNSSTLGTVYRG